MRRSTCPWELWFAWEGTGVSLGGRAHGSQQSTSYCQPCDVTMFKPWRARDVAELAQGRRRTNHLRLGRGGRARGGRGRRGGGAAIRTEPTSGIRRGNMWRSRVSIGPRFVHRRRAERIETAEERQDWIFVLDFAESMAETIMTQRKKIKTVTWTGQVLFILANMARTSHVGRQEWSQQLHPTQHPFFSRWSDLSGYFR